MYSDGDDRDGFYKLMKRTRAESSRSFTNKLVAPTGTYFGTDVLEVFAADAEYLGKPVGESNEFYNEFYRLCIEDNMSFFLFQRHIHSQNT